MPKVSVIIPVYNVEKYLRKCLDSVVNQTLKDIEIICVNDGSTDSSGKILDEYAAKDERIKVIHKQNEGVSISRNIGLSMATGKYIHFLDADDFIKRDTYKEIIDIMQKDNLDCYLFGYLDYTNNEFKPSWIVHFLENYKNKIVPIETAIIYFYRGQCNRLWKREYILKHKLKFPEHMKIAEDSAFGTLAALGQPKLAFTEKAYYYYRRDNVSSATHNLNFLISEEIETNKYIRQTKEYQNASVQEKLAIDVKTALSLHSHTANFNHLSEHDLAIIKKYISDLQMNYGKNIIQNNLVRRLYQATKIYIAYKFFLFGFIPLLKIEEA